MNKKLSSDFYLQNNAVDVAKQLLGKVLVTKIDGFFTSGIITETEAYAGETDRASHAYGGRRTKRTETMYMKGGTAYIYLCYGLHCLFNVVTNQKNIPHAVLIRSIEPTNGIEIINQRLFSKKMKQGVNGPAKVSTALGITLQHDKINLQGNEIFIEDKKIEVPKSAIKATPRIGVDYAGQDALLPYRFIIGIEQRNGKFYTK